MNPFPDLDVPSDGVAHPLLPREELLQGAVLGPVVGDGDGRLPQHPAGFGVDLVHHGRPGLLLGQISIDIIKYGNILRTSLISTSLKQSRNQT